MFEICWVPAVSEAILPASSTTDPAVVIPSREERVKGDADSPDCASYTKWKVEPFKPCPDCNSSVRPTLRLSDRSVSRTGSEKCTDITILDPIFNGVSPEVSKCVTNGRWPSTWIDLDSERDPASPGCGSVKSALFPAKSFTSPRTVSAVSDV